MLQKNRSYVCNHPKNLVWAQLHHQIQKFIPAQILFLKPKVLFIKGMIIALVMFSARYLRKTHTELNCYEQWVWVWDGTIERGDGPDAWLRDWAIIIISLFHYFYQWDFQVKADGILCLTIFCLMVSHFMTSYVLRYSTII